MFIFCLCKKKIIKRISNYFLNIDTFDNFYFAYKNRCESSTKDICFYISFHSIKLDITHELWIHYDDLFITPSDQLFSDIDKQLNLLRLKNYD